MTLKTTLTATRKKKLWWYRSRSVERIPERGTKTCVQPILLTLSNFPVLCVSPRLRPQPNGLVASGVSFFGRDALEDYPFSLRVDKIFTRHNEGVARYALLSLFQSRSCGNPEGIITVTTFKNIVGRFGLAPLSKRVWSRGESSQTQN